MSLGSMTCVIPASPDDVQAAIDSLAATGGTVYLPSTENWDLRGTRSNGLVICHPGIRLIGDGPGVSHLSGAADFGGTRVWTSSGVKDDPDPAKRPKPGVKINASHVRVEGIGFYNGDTTAEEPQFGIQIDGAHGQIDDVVVRNCLVSAYPGGGVQLINAHRCVIEDTIVRWAYAAVTADIQGGSRLRFYRCTFTARSVGGVQGSGVRLLNCDGISLVECQFEPSWPPDPLYDNTTEPFLRAAGATNVQVSRCWFEEHMSNATYGYFIQLDENCHGWLIRDTLFVRANTEPGVDHSDPKTVLVDAANGHPCRSIVLLNPSVNLATGSFPAGASHVVWNGQGAECYLLGGVALDNDQGTPRRGPLVVSDSTDRSAALAGIKRLRLPRADEATLAAPLAAGDVVDSLSTTSPTHRVAVRNKVAWTRIQES